jgi:hypothetical protein
MLFKNNVKLTLKKLKIDVLIKQINFVKHFFMDSDMENHVYITMNIIQENIFIINLLFVYLYVEIIQI